MITQNTVLRNDVGPCPRVGIIIGADNITLNLNGHRVLGNSDMGAGGEFAGIRLAGRTGVTVVGHPGGQRSGRMGTVSGFEAGVVLDGGSANTVKNLIIRDNIGPDDPFSAELGDGVILFNSASNQILNNVVAHNGIYDGIGVLGGDADGNVIRDNTVTDTIGPSDGGPAGQGIIVNAAGLGDNTGAVIEGTITEHNTVRRSGSAGIANTNNVGAQILRNVVEDNGLTNRQGHGIGIQLGPFAEVPFTRALVQANQVHNNGVDGIQVQKGATENRIIDNNAADNNVLCRGSEDEDCTRQRGFDLHDLNPGCDSNVWSGNTWGSGYYSPFCTAAGGSGPVLPLAPEGPIGDPSCSDGFDNDQDGLVDGNYDPDCAYPTESWDLFGSCLDGFDNDKDGLTDGADPDCAPPATPEGPAGARNCIDRTDNDRDGLVDAADPDCQEGPPGDVMCSDGRDNDLDGFIDGDDPSCQAVP